MWEKIKSFILSESFKIFSIISTPFTLIIIIFLINGIFHDSNQEKINALYQKTKIILGEDIKDCKSDVRKVISIVVKLSEKSCVDPELIVSQIIVESFFNENCVSWAGATGMMQIMWDDWVKKLGYKKSDLFDIEKNIEIGIYEMKQHLKSKKTIVEALYRYNGMHKSEGKKTVTISKESYYYVIRVMNYYYQFKNLEL
jgi:soluble lytic murein transglycosylase-like protein